MNSSSPYIPKWICITALLVSSVTPLHTAGAQFINFHMEVIPEISAEVVQDLDFGTFIANSGIQRIDLGSPSMGVFELRGLNNQPVIVTLDPPGQLYHTDPSVDGSIPVTLQAAYSHSESFDPANTVPINGHTAWFLLSQRGDGTDEGLNQVSAYVYIYGTVSIGDVREGNYSGDLVLSVEYQ